MSENRIDLTRLLNDKQRKVCLSSENFIVTACPGSGKTRTIIYRLAYLQEKYPDSRKYNIAITYTNRAADEICNRLDTLGINMDNIWTGTIHQFCMHFIIRPYSMYSDALKKGYHIIDEYVQKKYLAEISSLLGIDVGFDNPLNYPVIKENYEYLLKKNKEIDFSMILRYSLELVRKNSFIAENLSKIIRSIHVDEYQDTNEWQYNILAEIVQKNRKINVVFVGDKNQAIYGNLGGIVKTRIELEKLYGIAFREECLDGCYRSTQRLVDYYTNFEISRTGIYSVAKIKDKQGVISYNKTIHKDSLADEIAKIIKKQLDQGIPSREICIVGPQWYDIFALSNRLRKLLPDVPFDAPDIAPFKYDRLNPFYLFARLLFTRAGEHTIIRKRLAAEVIEILQDEYQITFPEGYDIYDLLNVANVPYAQTADGLLTFESAVKRFIKQANIKGNSAEELFEKCQVFIEKAEDRIKRNKLPHTCSDFCQCFKEREGVVINTIHGVKGEEYTTMIGFDLVNFRLPHKSYYFEKKDKRHDDTNKLLYVLCSRAKENLFLFSERGRNTKNIYSLAPTDELVEVRFKYDSI